MFFVYCYGGFQVGPGVVVLVTANALRSGTKKFFRKNPKNFCLFEYFAYICTKEQRNNIVMEHSNTKHNALGGLFTVISAAAIIWLCGEPAALDAKWLAGEIAGAALLIVAGILAVKFDNVKPLK